MHYTALVGPGVDLGAWPPWKMLDPPLVVQQEVEFNIIIVLFWQNLDLQWHIYYLENNLIMDRRKSSQGYQLQSHG